MTEKEVDLIGMVCPYAVVNIVNSVDKMQPGETAKFVVDDPLCIKSTPEELGDRDDVEVTIERVGKAWEITITKK